MGGGREVFEGVWSGADGLLAGDLVDVDEGCFGTTVGAGVDFKEDGDELEGLAWVSCVSYILISGLSDACLMPV